MKTHLTLQSSDYIGIASSSMCAIHCALAPVFFSVRPLAGMVHPFAEWWEAADWAFLALSLLAVWYSSKHTPHGSIRTFLWAAWAGFALGLFLEERAPVFGAILMYGGSLALVITHFRHIRLCRPKWQGAIKRNGSHRVT